MQYQVSIIPNNIILSHISFRLRQKDNRELYIGYISKTGKLARLIQAHARPPHLKIEGNSCNSRKREKERDLQPDRETNRQTLRETRRQPKT